MEVKKPCAKGSGVLQINHTVVTMVIYELPTKSTKECSGGLNCGIVLSKMCLESRTRKKIEGDRGWQTDEEEGKNEEDGDRSERSQSRLAMTTENCCTLVATPRTATLNDSRLGQKQDFEQLFLDSHDSNQILRT